MSLFISTIDGKQIQCGFDGPFVDRVMMGDYIIPFPCPSFVNSRPKFSKNSQMWYILMQ